MRLRAACGSAVSVSRGCAISGAIPPAKAVFRGHRYNHSVASICSRVSTICEPLRVTERKNVRLVKDHDEFHSSIYSLPERETAKTEDLIVSVFVSKQNTASLSVLDCVDRLSLEFPANTFLVIDADQVPRAAYDADLQQFPAALLSFGGDVYRRLIQENGGYPPDWQGTLQWELPPTSSDGSPSVDCVLPGLFYKSVKDGIVSFGNAFNEKDISSIRSRCGTHSYTHGIDTDNLNVKRVGWPTE